MDLVTNPNVLEDTPKEVWTLIFEQFLDKPPCQLQNSRLACSTFKNLIDSMPQRKFQQVLLLIYPFLDHQDRLNLRLVSKHCKTGIDMILENFRSSHRKSNGMLRPFKHVDDLQRFHESFKCSHSASCNPFPGRSFVVSDDEYDYDLGLHVNLIKNLLPVVTFWGSHLKTMVLGINRMLWPEVPATVIKILNLTPNVCKLKLLMNDLVPYTIEDTPAIIPELPELKCLKNLSISFLDYPLLNKFAFGIAEKNCKTLERLRIDGTSDRRIPLIVSYLEFPKLTKFKFTIRHLWLINVIFENWYMSQLTHMTLKFNFDDNDLPEFEQTMKITSLSVGETLESLTLWNWMEDMVIRKEHLNFPLLKELTLLNVYAEPTFVVDLPSLETLCVSDEGVEEGSEDEYLKTLWASQPTLETIVFGNFRKMESFCRMEPPKQD